MGNDGTRWNETRSNGYVDYSLAGRKKNRNMEVLHQIAMKGEHF